MDIYLKTRRPQQFGGILAILQQCGSVHQSFRSVPCQIAGRVFRVQPKQMLQDAQKGYLLRSVCDLWVCCVLSDVSHV